MVLDNLNCFVYNNFMETATVLSVLPYMVAIEETRYLSDEARALTGRYWTLYVYDKNTVTHCCEITPSYWLVAYGFETEKRLSDEIPAHEKLRDELQADRHESDHYRHCAAVDALEATGMAERMGKATWDSMEAVEEYLSGNYNAPTALGKQD